MKIKKKISHRLIDSGGLVYYEKKLHLQNSIKQRKRKSVRRQ